ncbi:MAG: autotransporter-associated beta strand repeat-containing protein [Verrucomicrobia bacterium]|nr:autotransporter-associated beta strand repeat-containing protein [Verrucomicrobiota bacterium]
MKLKYMYHVSSLRAVSTVVAFLAVSAFSAQAAPQTWSAANGNWNTTDTNFTESAWTNGNSAIFGGTAGSTVTINTAGISAAGVTFNVNNDIINRTSTNTLTLSGGNIITVGSGLTATINAPLAGSGGVQVENTGAGASILNLGGISTVDGAGNAALGLIVGATTANNTVNLSSGGTMATTGTIRRSLFIGSSNFNAGLTSTGSNIVNISTPGSSGTPTFNVSGNGGRATIGYASSSNELNISNGAYVSQLNGSGTNTWEMGVLANANSNKITVSGTNSSIVFGSNQAINVGVAGDSNSVTISAGGLINTRRFLIGANGGDSNSVTITGTNSQATTNGANTNSLFEIGSTTGSNANFMSIAAGGRYEFGGSGQARNFAIGKAGDNNYLEVTGTNSQLNVTWSGSSLPVALGGNVTGPTTVTDGGTGNRLDVNNGGSANFGATSSLYALGTNSSVNLGNGTGVGTLTVGAATGYVAGVFLKNSTGRVNFNSGRLTAGAAGNLVSGLGKVDLKGDATVSTTFSSTISVVIEDSTSSGGDFIKEGSGTLDLTQMNTYTGDTIVKAGTLQMENAYLANDAAVRLFTGGKLNLNTGATDTIGALYFDGVLQAPGTWGGTGSGADNINTTYFAANSGKLLVVAVPEPGAALLSAVGLLALLRRRRA